MKLQWDQDGQRKFETGVSKGVLFVDKKGTAWNGLTSFDEAPSGAEPNKQYADNINYLTLVGAEEFGGTIEAFTYPDEFAVCNGEVDVIPGVTVAQQIRKSFDFAYRTEIGNDKDGVGHGYKINIIYNCLAGVSGRTYETIGSDPEAMTMSWEITTTPVVVEGFAKATAKLVFDSTKATAEAMKFVEDMLYGTETETSKLLPMGELIAALKALPAGTGEQVHG